MRKFLASVGNAKLLGKVNGELQHIADVRTLTESTLSFSNTQEEIRAGEGAQLMGRFSHDSGMTVTLTDAMFDLNYIALQVGAAIEGNQTALKEETLTADAQGKIAIEKMPQPLGNACGLNHVIVWYKEPGCGVDSKWNYIELKANDEKNPISKDITLGSEYANKKVCVEYFADKPEARGLSINANFIPAELVLILTTKLFAGDANAPETGKPVGSITVKVPRFSLDGTFDLSMAMSAAATMSLAGTALAVDNGSCDGAGIYAEIVEVETNSDASTGLKEVIIDVDDLTTVYGMYNDGHISVIDANEYSVKAGENDAQAPFTAGTEYTFTIGGKTFKDTPEA
jgi:hypothetical protein